METEKRIRSFVPVSVPIIFLTAYDGDEVREEILQTENCEFLAKPFFVSAFKEKILEMQDEQTDQEKVPDEKEPENLRGRHLLVAEDNEINAEILEELLDIEEVSCVIVENGRLALERFGCSAPGEFDAILMDVQMPEMNGYDATKAIRSLEREDAGSIPIIAMTANAFTEDVKDAMAAGMNAHISKPIDMELLMKTLNQYI